MAFLLAWTAIAQSPEDTLRSKITTLRYDPLAEHARVQGDVHLKLNSGLVTVLSGHPLLAKTAMESAKAFGSNLGRADVDVKYHFVIVDTTISVPTSRTVKRGNAFERAVLRMFRLKTEKVVVDYRCEQGIAPPNELKIGGAVVEIWIYGRTFCLQTNAATVVARR